MISIVKKEHLEDYKIKLFFSDGSDGVMDFGYLIEVDSILTNPLKESGYFNSCFVDFGALCWKNGLELSAESLYRKLQERGLLRIRQNVA